MPEALALLSPLVAAYGPLALEPEAPSTLLLVDMATDLARHLAAIRELKLELMLSV